MTAERVDLRGAEATLLMTLYLRDRDARSARPILGDTHASEVLSRLEYDFTAFRRLSFDTATINSRARCFDRWAEEFLAAHPDGQVLHLGCGLDSRPLRIARPDTARWVDVDCPGRSRGAAPDRPGARPGTLPPTCRNSGHAS